MEILLDLTGSQNAADRLSDVHALSGIAIRVDPVVVWIAAREQLERLAKDRDEALSPSQQMNSFGACGSSMGILNGPDLRQRDRTVGDHRPDGCPNPSRSDRLATSHHFRPGQPSRCVCIVEHGCVVLRH